MKHWMLAILMGVLLAGTIGQTSAQPAKPKLARLKPKANYVMGRCVTMGGRPLANVQIVIKGLTLASGQNTEIVTKTKADGSYSIRVPAGIYQAYANHSVTAFGENYAFRLEALDGESNTQESPQGVVEDFVWKINGLRIGEKAKADSEREWNYAYYGARLYPDTTRSLGEYTNLEDATSLSKSYPADSQLEITLTPASNVVDGSKGKPIVQLLRLGDVGLWKFGVRNIPVAIYTATAKVITPTGEKVAVRCKTERADTVPWRPSARVVFPAYSGEFGQTITLFLARP